MPLRDRALAGTRRKRRDCRVRRANPQLRKPADFSRKLDLVLARLEHLEQRLNQQSVSNESEAAVRNRTTRPQLLALHPQTRGIVKLNQQTGCFEYYGRCCTMKPSNPVTNLNRANVNFPDCLCAWEEV